MKYSGLFALSAALASTANASPIPHTDSQTVVITFEGAADAQFTQSFPTDGAAVEITNPLSISHIVGTTAGVDCTFHGIDNSVTEVNGAGSVDVGPPQTQISGSCLKTWTHERRSAGFEVTFKGAGGAEFKQNFQNGQDTTITNSLSISQIVGAAGAECVFVGVDNQATIVEGASTVTVKTPQAQKEGYCRKLASKRAAGAEVTFKGAGGAEFKQTFQEGVDTTISNSLSISQIVGAAGSDCIFVGSDNQLTTVRGAETVTVATPQAQTQGLCRPSSSKRSQNAEVTFEGAAGAQFKQDFAVDGPGEKINNALSISKIVGAAGARCVFLGSDNQITEVNGASTVTVATPQTQTFGRCISA